jgi:hypothetical protein
MPALELHQRQGVYLEVQIFREFLIHTLQTWRPTQVTLCGLFQFFIFNSFHYEAHYVKAPCKSLILSPNYMEYHLCCRQSLLYVEVSSEYDVTLQNFIYKCTLDLEMYKGIRERKRENLQDIK